MRIYIFIGTLLLSLFVQCSKAQNESLIINNQNNSAIQYLALGDSYTIGEAADTSQRFPNLLASKLKQDGMNCEVRIFAKTGWTTDELLSAIKSASNLRTQYDLVSLLIGVNNQYRGYSIIQYHEEFKNLLEIAVDFAGGNLSKIFVLSIPDYSVTPFGQSRPQSDKIANEIDEYNKIAREICQQKGIAYFEITTISREALNDTELIANDGLHPSGKMYARWIDEFYLDIKSLIIK